jgi:electron transport complex protein RnfD
MLKISPSPHIHDNVDTRRLMRDVVIALMPTLLVSAYFFGLRTLVITGVSIFTCVALEWFIGKYALKTKSTIGDLSAVVTGLILAFNLPPTLPLGMVVAGAAFAIGIVKLSFGGLGCNPFNPAIVGRIFLLISFPKDMTTWVKADGFNTAWSLPADAASLDAVTGATPLGIIKGAMAAGNDLTEVFAQYNFSYLEMLFGKIGGSFGEVSVIALLIGFAYMLIRRVITWHIPVYIFAAVTVFGGILWLVNPAKYPDPVFGLLTGGLMLGAIFMATDYVTSPMTKKGMLIFGAGIGLLTIIIRTWGSYPEGISFAILIMNAFVPLINRYVKPKRFGEVVKNG